LKENILGVATGRFARFLQNYCPYVLLSIPVVISELVASVCNTAFGTLIGEYLLRTPAFYEVVRTQIILGLLEVLSWVVSFIYLRPIFKVHRRRRNSVDVDAILFRQAATRLYNFPAFLIVLTLVVSAIETGFVFFSPEIQTYGPILSFTSYILVAVLINTVVIYYLADSLNRFYFFPDWFKDGKFDVTFRLRSPGLSFRFFDAFLVNGIFPVITITGVFFVADMQSKGDPDIYHRALVVSATIGGLYWLLGLMLVILNSRLFLLPLDTMEQATEALGRADYDTRVAIHSDDQIGKLERAINQMGQTLREKETIKQVFGHYVSPAIRDMILEGRVKTDGDRIEAVVLFSDIRSFTSLSEKYPPEKIIKLLNLHFSRVVETVVRNNGFVDKFIGDAVMAVFDAELTSNMHRWCALKTAAEMLGNLQETNREIANLGIEPIRIGIGLACGSVIRGNVGSENRREMTVIGNIVNLASRLEAATQELGCPIVATLDTYDESCSHIALLKIIERKSFSVRGRSEPIEILTMSAE